MGLLDRAVPRSHACHRKHWTPLKCERDPDAAQSTVARAFARARRGRRGHKLPL